MYHIVYAFLTLIVTIDVGTLARSAMSEIDLSRMSCTDDAQCRNKYTLSNSDFVCCVTVSCSDSYEYYDLSAGCAPRMHCLSKESIITDPEHFAGW